MDRVTFEIVEHIGVLNSKPNGWTKEANVVVWNHGEPKVDIREWNEDHTRMTKGITLTDDEAVVLLNAMMKWKGVV